MGPDDWAKSRHSEARNNRITMPPRHGSSSPVFVADGIDWDRDYSSTRLDGLVGMTDVELATVDPLAMNLIVAKGTPSLAHLEIEHYQRIANSWTDEFRVRCLPHWESFFHQAPHDFGNDIRLFRLGMLCQYLDLEVGVQYNLDQRGRRQILYTNPSDLFLNGLLDTRQGTCGNMAALHVAIGWRMGWPVSLACVDSHFICRYDDGQRIYNLEATQAGFGGFKSDPDEYLIETKNLPAIAIQSGSDLRALRPREMLGAFVGLRARHLQDVGKQAGSEEQMLASEPDWLLARQLFPANRVLYKNQMVITTMRGATLFDADEAGHPLTYAACLDELRLHRARRWGSNKLAPPCASREPSAGVIDELFSRMEVNP